MTGLSPVLAGMQRWKALMTREFTLIKRTMIMYKAKSFQIFVLGLCAATLFLRTHVRPVSPEDGQEIAGFTFFGLLVIMVNGIAEMAMAVSSPALPALPCPALPHTALPSPALPCLGLSCPVWLCPCPCLNSWVYLILLISPHQCVPACIQSSDAGIGR